METCCSVAPAYKGYIQKRLHFDADIPYSSTLDSTSKAKLRAWFKHQLLLFPMHVHFQGNNVS